MIYAEREKVPSISFPLNIYLSGYIFFRLFFENGTRHFIAMGKGDTTLEEGWLTFEEEEEENGQVSAFHVARPPPPPPFSLHFPILIILRAADLIKRRCTRSIYKLLSLTQ